jgi:hypothetical protein
MPWDVDNINGRRYCGPLHLSQKRVSRENPFS